MSNIKLSMPVAGFEYQKSQREVLVDLLKQDLNFHDQNSRYSSHNFHAFPAKFPPQLPRKFITYLTNENDIVLDPMMGSGTTLLEALLAGRHGIGFDIDPLALLIANVKFRTLDIKQVEIYGKRIIEKAFDSIKLDSNELQTQLVSLWDSESKDFLDYWFTLDAQLELFALLKEINKISDYHLQSFFKLAFSAVIITKSGGVSLALDLAHTRPHKSKIAITKDGQVLYGKDLLERNSHQNKSLIKTLRSPIEEFDKRYKNNLNDMLLRIPSRLNPLITFGDAQHLPIPASSIDLVVTSPPYASNAIDYMRAHKFSLVWLGYPLGSLAKKRTEYIGSETTTGFHFEHMPPFTTKKVNEIMNIDPKKGLVLLRYYSEMAGVIHELYRVLKPGKTAIVVVGSSIIRGKDTETHKCLAEIGENIGFEVPAIGIRRLDRNRRMLPAGHQLDPNSQIQQRMHEEFIIGFYKP